MTFGVRKWNDVGATVQFSAWTKRINELEIETERADIWKVKSFPCNKQSFRRAKAEVHNDVQLMKKL